MFTFAVGSQSMNTTLMTPAVQNTDVTVFQHTYWHNLQFVALSEDGCFHSVQHYNFKVCHPRCVCNSYIFTRTRHLTLTLTLALPLWVRFILFGWIKNTNHIFEHLIPQGTPTLLIPFIVIIETIRNLIRPGTLAVRLTANIIAGQNNTTN